MDIIEKIKKRGLKQSIRMVSVKFKKKALVSRKNPGHRRLACLENILKREYERIIVFENHFGFYNIMLQRPQHITKALSDENTLVFYNSFYDIDFKSRERLRKMGDHFFVIDLFYYRRKMFEMLRNKRVKKYVMIYSTDTVSEEMVKIYRKNGFRVIYEYVDDINPELISGKKMSQIKERHYNLVADKENYVITTAEKLYQNVIRMNREANVCLISNGADCGKFVPGKRTDDQTYLNWMKKDKIKLGYYGALASWVDYELLRKLAENKDFQIILIGVEHDDSLKESGLLDYDNVRYFGKIAYDLLPGYANEFDICMIPFVLNEITKATSPVKLFEYMAMQKPVITTELPECQKYSIVRTTGDVDKFIEYIYELYERKDDNEYKAELARCANENSWRAKALDIKHFLNQGENDER